MRKNMVKWKPFYSIPGLSKLIKEIECEKNKYEMPIITEELMEDINYTIKEAIENNLVINIKYFRQGMLMYEIGRIKKINTYEKYILINNTKIYFKNIINVHI